ncbi:MAG: thioredoxin family protein [Robiginitomaculum sp.]|nr:thioredoxin family protein [Robiginitomaculum sp.]
MRIFFASLLLVWFSLPVLANPVTTDNARATLISDQQTIKAGDEFHLGLEMVLRKHWHTYWVNPGDAGLATEIQWELPIGLSAGPIKWPTPKAIFLGQLVNYGYEDTTLYPIAFTAGPDFATEGPFQIKGFATWLVCEDICIPEQAELILTLNTTNTDEIAANAKRIEQALDGLPKPVSAAQITAGFTATSAAIQFHFSGPLVNGSKISKQALRFFPFDTGAVKHAALQSPSFGENGFTLWTKPGFRTRRGTLEAVGGVLVIGTGKSAQAWQVEAQAGLVPTGTGATTNPADQPAPTSTGLGGLLTALIFAFLGGVLLNLMPCVFPVLSMKVMSFVSAAHSEAAIIRKHGILFLIGVLVSFLALGGLFLALKAGGQQIGWGFQLQYPPFVAAISVLFFVLGLNLLGVFHMGSRLMGVGGSLADKGGNAGAFFTGVLAVVVASPCTAPAMGWALGFTLSQSAAVSMLVFLALGLGFAAPFTLLSIQPRLLKFLPKPGPWMGRFHQLMAFPMFAAAVWLVWVLAGLSGVMAVAALLSAFILIGFAFWAWKGQRFSKAAGVIAAGLALLVIANGISAQGDRKLEPQVWSSALVTQYQSEGKTIFVDFTADWCVTCQFNKRTALASKSVAAAFAQEDVQFLVADWTRRDDEIATELARHGRAGVPLYLVYRPEQAKPQILPQLLTPQIVKSAVTKGR